MPQGEFFAAIPQVSTGKKNNKKKSAIILLLYIHGSGSLSKPFNVFYIYRMLIVFPHITSLHISVNHLTAHKQHFQRIQRKWWLLLKERVDKLMSDIQQCWDFNKKNMPYFQFLLFAVSLDLKMSISNFLAWCLRSTSKPCVRGNSDIS